MGPSPSPRRFSDRVLVRVGEELRVAAALGGALDLFEPSLLPTNHQREPQVSVAALESVRWEARLALAAVERDRSPLKSLRRLERKLAALAPLLPSKLPPFVIGPA